MDEKIAEFGQEIPPFPMGKEEMMEKVAEELETVNKRLERHKEKKEIATNLEQQKKILEKQKGAVADLPDVNEYMKRMQQSMTILIKLGKDLSKLEKQYIELIDK